MSPFRKDPIPLAPAAVTARDAIINEAAVQVVVSFPSVTLRVSEAEGLRRGVVLDLRVRLAEAAMTVQLENKVIGEGRLVLVGANAGVWLRSEQE